MKNIVFIPNIDCGDGRNNPYHYSINSYIKWSEQYDNIDVIEWTEPLMDTKEFPIIYQREWVLDILDHNEIDYDQVAVVDSDTIIHPDCPNFFEETNHEYSVVINNGCYEWVLRGINGWGEYLFPEEERPKLWDYHNSGFVILNKKHKWFQDIVKEFYLENIDKINDIRNNKQYQGLPIPSTGQTIINFLLQKHKVNKNILPERYNFGDLFRKNLLHTPNYSWWPDELTFLDAGWIYHFNAIPGKDEEPRHTEYWMKRTYGELYG